MELITRTEFAKRVGVSNPYITKLVKAGRLPITNNKIDYERCKIIFEQIRSGQDRNNQNWNEEQKGKGAEGAAADRFNKPNKEPLDLGTRYQAARAADMALKAKTKEIEFKKLIGEVIDVRAVKYQIEQISNIVRTRLNKFPSKYAARCEGQTAIEIEEIMGNGIKEILEEFQDMLNDVKKKNK